MFRKFKKRPEKFRHREGDFSGQPHEERGKSRGGKTGVFSHGYFIS